MPLFCAVLDAGFGSPLVLVVFIMLRQALYNVISSVACNYNEPWCQWYYIFSLLKLQQPNETIRGHGWRGIVGAAIYVPGRRGCCFQRYSAAAAAVVVPVVPVA